MNIKSFKHEDWTKIYDGRWSFLTSTHFIQQYTKELLFGGKPFKSQSIIFISHGRSNGWMRQSDRDRLGNYLAQRIVKNPKEAKVIANKLKFQAKGILKFIDQYEGRLITKTLYDEFWKRVLAYYHPHINVKYVVDYLHPDLLKQYLPSLQEARLTAEPVLNRTEDFMIRFVKLLSKETKYSYQLLLCLIKEEVNDYFNKRKLPNKLELKKRDAGAVLIREKDSFQFLIGPDISKIEKIGRASCRERV